MPVLRLIDGHFEIKRSRSVSTPLPWKYLRLGYRDCDGDSKRSTVGTRNREYWAAGLKSKRGRDRSVRLHASCEPILRE